MKILTPLNNLEVLDPYIRAGSDEFYLGFYDTQWFDRFGEYADINRMSGFKKYANQYTFEECITIVERIKSLGKDAFITLNANCYSKEELDYIDEHYLGALKDVGVDGIIVSELHLAEVVIAAGLVPVASTMCGIYNSDIAMAYVEHGVKRIILPRDLSLDEIESITGKLGEDIYFEAFFMRNGCSFSDAYCLGMHRQDCGGATCGWLRNTTKSIRTLKNAGFSYQHDVELNDMMYEEYFHKFSCGMCSLYRLYKAGINSLKIVGRADNCKQVCEDIALTKSNIDIMNQCDSEEEYLSKMLFPKNARKACKLGLSCYYPETRF